MDRCEEKESASAPEASLRRRADAGIDAAIHAARLPERPQVRCRTAMPNPIVICSSGRNISGTTSASSLV